MALRDSQLRLEAVRSLTTAALGRAADGHVDRALVLTEAALAKFQHVEALFGPDELAIDSLIAALAVCGQIAKDPAHAASCSRARELLQAAVDLRVVALVGS